MQCVTALYFTEQLSNTRASATDQVASVSQFWLLLQLIHMDLKSKNILLSKAYDLAKIADVGLSRIIQSTLGGHGSNPYGVGTFEYTAPEIFLGRQCSAKVGHASHIGHVVSD